MSEKFLTKRVKCKHFSIPFNNSIGYYFLCRKFTPTSYEQCPCAAIEEPEDESCNNCVNNGSGMCDDCREDGNSNWEKKK